MFENFKILGQKFVKLFGIFFGKLKGHSEITWPLERFASIINDRGHTCALKSKSRPNMKNHGRLVKTCRQNIHYCKIVCKAKMTNENMIRKIHHILDRIVVIIIRKLRCRVFSAIEPRQFLVCFLSTSEFIM